MAAKSGPSCKDQMLPVVPNGTSGRPSWSPTSAPTRGQYGNQGVLLNSDALKQALFGPIDGPAAQQRADRTARMTRLARHASSSSASSRVIMALLTVFLFFTFGQYRTGSTNGYSAVFTDASRLKAGDTVRVAGIRVGTVTDVSLQAGSQGAGRLRRRPQDQADQRHQGRDPLPQPHR